MGADDNMSAIELYQHTLQQILDRVFDEQGENLEKVAARLCDCVTSGHFLYIFGTGHAHILAEEMFYRAGGLAAVIPILDEELMLHVSASGSTTLERQAGYAAKLLEKYNLGTGDMLIVCSNSGRNAVPVEMAAEARKRGAFVVDLFKQGGLGDAIQVRFFFTRQEKFFRNRQSIIVTFQYIW